MTVDIQDMIKCAARELKMRETVFAKRVAGGSMTAANAEYEINVMAAILENLKAQVPEQASLFGLDGSPQ